MKALSQSPYWFLTMFIVCPSQSHDNTVHSQKTVYAIWIFLVQPCITVENIQNQFRRIMWNRFGIPKSKPFCILCKQICCLAFLPIEQIWVRLCEDGCDLQKFWVHFSPPTEDLVPQCSINSTRTDDCMERIFDYGKNFLPYFGELKVRKLFKRTLSACTPEVSNSGSNPTCDHASRCDLRLL